MTVEIRRLREADVRPLVEGLWLPFAREMAELADRNALADGADLVAENEPARGFYEGYGFESVGIRMAVEPASDGE